MPSREGEAFTPNRKDNGFAEDRKGPLIRSLDRMRHLTQWRPHLLDVLAMLKHRFGRLDRPARPCCHTYCPKNGGTIEHVQQIANHESPRTTKLYDRTNDAVSLDERAWPAASAIERILMKASTL